MLAIVAIMVGFLVTASATPVVRRLGVRWRILDVPNPLSIHRVPIPRIGGLAIFIGFLSALALFSWLTPVTEKGEVEKALGVIAGSTLIFLLGFRDDHTRLSPRAKLLGQLLAATLTVWLQVRVHFFPLPSLAFGLGVFYLVAGANALNLLDGMNGLAAGVAAIACGFLAGLAWMSGDAVALILALSLLGPCLGFLVHNFGEARIFMGDQGSLFMGFTLAAIAALLASHPLNTTWLIGPLLVLGVPIFDTAFAILRRIISRAALLDGDRNHTYDLLQGGGLSQTETVLSMYALAVLLGTAALILAGFGRLAFGVSLFAPALLVGMAVIRVRVATSRPPALSQDHGPGNHGTMLAHSDPGQQGKEVVSMSIRQIRTKRLILPSLDAVLSGGSYMLAYSLLSLHPWNDMVLTTTIWSLPVVIIVKLLAFYAAGLYRGFFNYAGTRELREILKSLLFATLAVEVSLFLLGVGGATGSVLVLDLLFSTVFIAGSRLALPLIREWYLEWQRRSRGRRVLIYGAGDAGESILREMLANGNISYLPVGVIDDDPEKRGRMIQGVRVLGQGKDLPNVARRARAEEVILSIPSAGTAQRKTIVERLQAAGFRCRTVPSLEHWIESGSNLSQLREVRPEDFLIREPVQVDAQAVEKLLRDKVVLVTGAGGSIGSQLCREIVRYGPRMLLLLDRAENSLYFLERDLEEISPAAPALALVGDINDRHFLEELFEEHGPAIVFHTAAYKHVPLLETTPRAALQNNILGSKQVADISHESGVETFVLVSTDKAVNPQSVMGASKRVAELYVAGLSRHSRTRFITVRFGNVLGSDGSVFPLFLRQIARGGPVTVTTPEMTRYMMTISEAAELILQAGAMGESEGVYLLEMGEPVKILSLARDLIAQTGWMTGRDVPIVFTGQRPGEKINEELWDKGEQVEPTNHPGVLKVHSNNGHNWHHLNCQLEWLASDSSLSPDFDERLFLQELLPNYAPTNGSAAKPSPASGGG